MARKTPDFASLDYIYLYGDGHAVAMHRKYNRVTGRDDRWCELHESWGPKVRLPAGDDIVIGDLGRKQGQGRLIVKRAPALLMRRADYVRAEKTGTHHGSEKSQRIGLVLGLVTVTLPNMGELLFYSTPDLMCADIEYQAHFKLDGGDPTAAWDPNVDVGQSWGVGSDTNIARIWRKEG